MKISDLNEGDGLDNYPDQDELNKIEVFLGDWADEFFNVYWDTRIEPEENDRISFEDFLEWMSGDIDYIKYNLDLGGEIIKVNQAIDMLNLNPHKKKQYLRNLWKHWYQNYYDYQGGE